MNKLLSPRMDFIFKRIFGDPRNIDILVSFLQAVLDLPDEEYDTVTIVDPFLKKEFPKDKLGILDVHVSTKSGRMVAVEIQILETHEMRERIVYYTSKMITGQMGAGDKYKNIKKVISIVICDYYLVADSDNYHNRYTLYDKDTKSQFTDIFEINALELPKVPHKDDDSELWDWMSFLRAESEVEFSMAAQRNTKVQKAVGVLKELSQDEETRLIYEAREKAWRDEQSRMDGEFEKGEAIGIEKGESIGIKKRDMETLRNMIKSNFSLPQMSAALGIPEANIKKMLEELEK